MDYKEKWETIRRLGKGRQGEVFLVHNKLEALASQDRTLSAFRNLVGLHSGSKTLKKDFDDLSLGINDRIKLEDPGNQGALKILHQPDNARDFELDQERIKNEIQAMHDIDHPNLLKIIDFDEESKWFVSEYHPKGSLSKYPNLYKGDILKTLNSIKPLIEGVAELHEEGRVHRDIKPQNIFLNSRNDLILGDFGLVFFQDEQHSRFSKEFSNVGSRDWMPPWAYGKRVDNIGPSFDIFSIAKVIWSMLSGIEILQLWYYEREDNNLEKIFPDLPEMRLMNNLLKICMVEHEADCLSDIKILIDEINEIVIKIEHKADAISTNIDRRCNVCCKGKYILIIDKDRDKAAKYFGLIPSEGDELFKIFTCSYCGHVQLFLFANDKNPTAWNE